MEIKIKEAYDTLKEVAADISGVVRSLSRWKERQLIEKCREGLGAINLICQKVLAEEEVAKRFGKNISLTLEDRREIVYTIDRLSYDLNVIAESETMRYFLGKDSNLAYLFFLKIYSEHEDHGPEEVMSNESDFLTWIRYISSDTDAVLRKLDSIET